MAGQQPVIAVRCSQGKGFEVKINMPATVHGMPRDEGGKGQRAEDGTHASLA